MTDQEEQIKAILNLYFPTSTELEREDYVKDYAEWHREDQINNCARNIASPERGLLPSQPFLCIIKEMERLGYTWEIQSIVHGETKEYRFYAWKDGSNHPDIIETKDSLYEAAYCVLMRTKGNKDE